MNSLLLSQTRYEVYNSIGIEETDPVAWVSLGVQAL
jgi:hypothetical protein